jgi:hypothetical protein
VQDSLAADTPQAQELEQRPHQWAQGLELGPRRYTRSAHRYAACASGIPVHNIEASRCRMVPHGGFAAVQDDSAKGALSEG